MYQIWPNKDSLPQFLRPDLDPIWNNGHRSDRLFDASKTFENKIAEVAGPKYEVAVDLLVDSVFNK